MVIVAEKAGACFGVERALRMALDAAATTTADGKPAQVHTLGPLIHNPIVVEDLAARGVTPIRDVAEAEPDSTVLLRTHGVTPQTEEAARATGATVLDATCPFVKKCHRDAATLAKEGYQVIVVGEEGHPEVEGTAAYAPGAVVVGSVDELAALDVKRRVGIVVQTTQTAQLLKDVVSALVDRCEELRVFNTICEATHERQDAALALAQRVDVMVVIGGKNSANTCHLAEICAAACAKTHHIEQASEIEPAWLEGAATIGVTAGASTPQAHIEAVVRALEELA